MNMDYDKLKNDLMTKGMREIDANTLIKIAKYKKTSVSRQFFFSLLGLYWFTFSMVLLYILFVSNMGEKESLVFTILYFSILFIMGIFTPFFKKLFWSLNVLFCLKGR